MTTRRDFLKALSASAAGVAISAEPEELQPHTAHAHGA